MFRMASGMMQQYHDAKLACGDALLLFRMGDFYELFYEDAKTVAKALNLTLTSRDKGENPIPMAGFPHHQLDSYLAKLIAAGFRVGVCEQVEDAKKAKGLVRREVTRIVTPGTLTDDALLDPRESNYLAAVAGIESETAGLAWIDLSTGRFFASSLPQSQLADELARIAPAECLVAQSADASIDTKINNVAEKISLTRRPDWAFGQAAAAEALAKHFGTAGLEGFGFEEADGPAIRAAGAILDYLSETQKTSLDHIDRLVPYRRGDCLEIDESTRRSLEIVRTMREGRREGSLLSVLDRTVTAMGARMLADHLANPLTDVTAINERLDGVEELVENASLSETLRDALGGVYDLERLLARVTTGRSSPRDLSFIGRTLAKLPAIKAKLTARNSDLLTRLETDVDLCPELRGKL